MGKKPKQVTLSKAFHIDPGGGGSRAPAAKRMASWKEGAGGALPLSAPSTIIHTHGSQRGINPPFISNPQLRATAHLNANF